MHDAALPHAFPSLFEPFRLKGLTVKNRLMRSPMVLSMAAPDGTVTDDLLHVYRQAAEGGVGLFCTGCMAVNADARMNWQQMGVWSDEHIGGLARLADTVHAYGDGCVIFAQIFSEGAHSWGYSYGQQDAQLDVNSLSDEQIRFIVEAFAAAALRIREADFDGVHLHGGHGYLISQFLSPAVNQRDDAWGGSVEKRATFAVEICRAIRARVGDDYPLGIKMNTADYLPGGNWQAQTARVARLLVDEGVDLIEMSGGMGYMIELREALRRRVGENEYYFWDAIAPFTEALRGTGVALAAVGGIRTPAVMDRIRAAGVDFISMARPWLCEPDLANRIKAGDLRTAKCVSSYRLCNLCLTKLAKGSVQCERFYPGDCRMRCPIAQDNPAMLALVASGDMAEALRVVKADAPLANTLGRVCHAPCETACRGKNGEPLSLRAVKRFVAEWGRENGVMQEAPRPPRRRRGKVAVVGSGPAGLTAAYYLAQAGYQTTVFERESVAGGMLALGIPAYRLPRDVLAADMDYVSSSGVEIRTGVDIGRDRSLDDLLRGGYDAVCLATGAAAGAALEVPGAGLAGVWQGLDLLRAVNLGGVPAVGAKVVVIGGGNVAVDAAMTTLRLGAQEVTIACLEQPDEMPAFRDAVADALEEGVRVKPGWGLRRIEGDRAVSGVELVRCESAFDASGALAPVYCEADGEHVAADTVVLAVGQERDWSCFGEGAFSCGAAASGAGPTARPGVFVAGDVMLATASVVEAMAAGRRAAECIDRYLSDPDGAASAAASSAGPGVGAERAARFAPFVPMVRASAFRDVAGTTLAEGSQRAVEPRFTREERRAGFQEITGNLTLEQAVAQARRCLKDDLELEAESAARLAQMGPAAFVLSADEDRTRQA